MRIQEMRSGLVHLQKKTDDIDIDEIFRRVEARIVSREPVCLSDLDKPIWSVISFGGTEAGGLTHHQAGSLLAALDGLGISGLCVVTDEAAARTSKQPSQNSR